MDRPCLYQDFVFAAEQPAIEFEFPTGIHGAISRVDQVDVGPGLIHLSGSQVPAVHVKGDGLDRIIREHPATDTDRSAALWLTDRIDGAERQSETQPRGTRVPQRTSGR